MSALPRNLHSALTTADLALSESRDGHLPVSLRRAVWDAMGQYQFTDEQFAYGLGHLRRTTLACFAAEAALGVWVRHGGDDQPGRVLDLVEHYLTGNADGEVLHEIGTELWNRADYLEEGPEAWVIFATYHAVMVAFSDELAPAEATQESEDSLNEYDAGYYAACALANGHPGDPGSSMERRRAFWRWYLESAVPAAFSIAQPSAAQ